MPSSPPQAGSPAGSLWPAATGAQQQSSAARPRQSGGVSRLLAGSYQVEALSVQEPFRVVQVPGASGATLALLTVWRQGEPCSTAPWQLQNMPFYTCTIAGSL